jgi:diguanylate cyclase (GGDEF)-like protein/PAS domain S-box-containing protein
MPFIMIVDDRATNRSIFSQLSISLGADVEVEAFAGPDDALAWISSKTPDLIITDYKMPQMTGAAFTRHIRATANGADVPIMVVTTYEDRDFRLRALEAGATDFLQSPIDHQEFVTRARNLLKLGTQQKLIRSRAYALAEELHHVEREREELVRTNHERLAQVIDTVPALISATDRQGHCIFANAFRTKLLPPSTRDDGESQGFNEERAASSSQLDARVFATGLPLPEFEEEIQDAEGRMHVFLTTKTPLTDESNHVTAVLTTSLDISDRKRAERYLHHLAHHDVLTGLPNRLLLHLCLEDAVATATQGQTVFALHFLDLDRFKSINDAFGHHVGDALLTEVAERLRRTVRATDTVARLGGDEFAIIQGGIVEAADAERLAQRIVMLFDKPYDLDGRAISTSCSLGFTLFPTDGTSKETLLKTADLAMYRSKSQGRNLYCAFEPAMQSGVREAALLEIDLRAGLMRNELRLYYQPQIDTRSGRVTGAEALVRWEQPGQGLLPPGRFLPIAEEAGLIIPINTWVLEEACRQAAAWAEAGMPLRVAVNLSATIFQRQDVTQVVMGAVRRANLDPRLLDLELTETMFLEDHETARRQLLELQRLGISFSIDDFGTGYASFSYIDKLPVNRLKIDQAFIHNLTHRAEGPAVIRSIIGLGRGLGLRVVAEGVETAEQLRELEAEGCDEVQGYLFSRPVPPQDFERYVRANWARTVEAEVAPPTFRPSGLKIGSTSPFVEPPSV